jgi:hypothetical protein
MSTATAAGLLYGGSPALAALAESFDPGSHPRADAGSPQGGQFTTAGGGGMATKTTQPRHATAHHRRRAHHVRIPAGVLGYDPGGDSGTGYGKRGGDPRVRRLQLALNRLGLVDGRGRRLKLDGKLGPRTTESVRAAQRRLGLTADGLVTPKLLRQLLALRRFPRRPHGASAREALSALGAGTRRRPR